MLCPNASHTSLWHMLSYVLIVKERLIGSDLMTECRKKGKMTVVEAGRKGGEATSEEHGEEFYREIGEKGGKKGGPRVRELIEEGKEHEEE